jgi:hypothetical protein
MTERTDQLLIEALRAPCPGTFTDLAPWREYRDQIHGALKLLDKRLEDADREEFEALQKRMAALQARLGVGSSQPVAAPVPEVAKEAEPAKPKRKAWKCGACERMTVEEVCPTCKAMGSEMTAPPSYGETDAGSGRGGSREPPMTTEEFREQLQGLRDRVTDRRARLGLG